MRTLTITRALNELKLLKNRHGKEIQKNFNIIAVKHGSRLKPPYAAYSPADFEKGIDPTYQSVVKLEEQIFEIKSKIDKSNSETIVKIGDKEMTVREAIAMKELIAIKEARLEVMKKSLENARAVFERALKENQDSISRQVSDYISNTTGKIDPEIEKGIVESTESLYKVEMIDHGLSDKIKALEKEIEDFKNNVDFVLSESNSITTIEISD